MKLNAEQFRSPVLFHEKVCTLYFFYDTKKSHNADLSWSDSFAKHLIKRSYLPYLVGDLWFMKNCPIPIFVLQLIIPTIIYILYYKGEVPSCFYLYYYYYYYSYSVTLRVPPLDSETGLTGELWLNRVLLILET